LSAYLLNLVSTSIHVVTLYLNLCVVFADVDPKEKQVDGLSVERLTLLGRVHVARVNVLDLTLQGHDLDSSNSSKTSNRSAKRAGKPPRPVRNKKPW
jgi:hypothetical protein